MINPLRSEAEAFRFLLGAIVYFGLIAIAAVVGGRWVGLAVFLVLSAIVVAAWLRARRVERPIVTAPTRRGGANELRILVIANETVGGEKLRELIRQKSEGVQEDVLVVTPALNAPLRHWVSDEDDARAAAQERLDALRTFGADEIVISTHPEGRSHWLEKGVVTKARERFAVPITHIVTDLEAEREEVR